jgi:hypothetical protein
MIKVQSYKQLNSAPSLLIFLNSVMATITKLQVTQSGAGTNDKAELAVFERKSTGSPANNFGMRQNFKLESDTTEGRQAAYCDIYWHTAADATRGAAVEFGVADNGVDATRVLRFSKISTGGGRTSALGIGTAPIAPLHINHEGATASGSPTFVTYENTNTTDPSGALIQFVTTTTGVGASTRNDMAGWSLKCVTHDHATRKGEMYFYVVNAGNYETLTLKAGRSLLFDSTCVIGASAGSCRISATTGVTLEATANGGHVNLQPNATNGVVQFRGTQILTARKTGWTAATGTATRTSFDTATVTLPQLAQAVKALIDDLISHGLIGA